MSQADRTPNYPGAGFHAVSHYDSPGDVLQDTKLSSAEKRVILSSWASDMYAVESQPAFRKVPGISQELRLSDILGALKLIDDDIDPPPRGAAVMRLPHFSSTNPVAPLSSMRRGAAANCNRAKASHGTHVSRWT